MAKNQELEFSTTAGSNTDIGGLGVDEGMSPSRVNDAIRYLMKTRADGLTRHVAKAAGSYTAVKADHNQYWRCTGAVTLNLTAAATLTDGWCLFVRANGGSVTIDPAGTELIDGATTYNMTDGQTAMVICTGTEFFLIDGGTIGQGFPAGSIIDYAGSTAPTGWLLCYGQSLLRATYPSLFTAIGTTYGAADGTHFSLPDCRGRVAAGRDDMGGSDAARLGGGVVTGTTLGAAGGSDVIALATAELPSHTHTQQGTFGSGGISANHTHGFTDNYNSISSTGYSHVAINFPYGVPTSAADNTGTVSSDHSHSTTIYGETAAAGSGTAHSNTQPTIILNKIICTGAVA